MKKLTLFFSLLFLLINLTNAQTVTDYDGNVYNTVTIGTQVWMKENLKVTHYQNGDSIPNITDSIQWYHWTTGAYCDYNNLLANSNLYGRLYNSIALMDSRNLCPIGWHVPSVTEWQTLSNFLGGNQVAGGKLKETNTVHWLSPNTGATNSSGFSALPGGERNRIYINPFLFNGINHKGVFLTSNRIMGAGQVYVYRLTNDSDTLYYETRSWWDGLSLRCIKDSTSSINENDNQKRIEVYPNPSTGIFTIQQNNTNTQKYSLSVRNIQGQFMLSEKVGFEKTFKLDISKFANGIYFLSLQNEKELIVKKLIKN